MSDWADEAAAAVMQDKYLQEYGDPNAIAEALRLERARALAVEAENARLREGLSAAIRAARLALFVIEKENVMLNESWQAGFDTDLRTAESARAALNSGE